MDISTLDKLLEDQLKDIYSAEKQLLKALPKMVKAASADTLKEALSEHLDETRVQVERLEQIGSTLDIKLTGKKCAAMEGLIEEGREIIAEAEGPDAIKDLALIAAAQRVEHYEISAYGSALALAEQLDQTTVMELLQETLDEESAADEKLTEIATDEVMPMAASAEDEEEEEEEETTKSKPRMAAARRGASKPSQGGSASSRR